MAFSNYILSNTTTLLSLSVQGEETYLVGDMLMRNGNRFRSLTLRHSPGELLFSLLYFPAYTVENLERLEVRTSFVPMPSSNSETPSLQTAPSLRSCQLF
jgi:hypothetical protein